MKLQIIKEDALLFLKENTLSLKKLYLNDNCEELIQHYDGTAFIETKYDIDEFALDMSEENPLITDIENVKRVFNRLRFISDSQATDERLWSYLSLSVFWKYVQYRWNVKANCTEGNILSHFYFNYSTRRSYTRNAIARLWWIGRLTYDETRDDPYELTAYLCKHPDYVMHLLERSQSNNLSIIRVFLQALIDSETCGKLINTDEFGELTKCLNLLGGSYIVDCLPEKELYKKISEKIEKMRGI